MPIKLLALDVDGTLLDPDGELRPVVRDAVTAARRQGLRVVLCTGRRLRTARPVLAELDLEGLVVVQNGVMIKDAATAETFHPQYLPASLYQQVTSLLSQAGPPLVYVDPPAGEHDIVTESLERSHPYQREYVEHNTAVTRFVESLEASPGHPVVMCSCMADGERLQELEREVAASLGNRVRTNFLINKNYRGYILEVVAAGSGKWPALRRLADAEGIEPEEIAAIGDDHNDEEMIREVGLGIAMGNAVAAVREVADRIAPSNAEDGAATAIERFVL